MNAIRNILKLDIEKHGTWVLFLKYFCIMKIMFINIMAERVNLISAALV